MVYHDIAIVVVCHSFSAYAKCSEKLTFLIPPLRMGVADIKRIEFKFAQTLIKVGSSVTQQAFTCSKSTKETEQDVKYVQS